MALAADVANLIVALKLDDSGFTGKLNNAARTLKGMDAGLAQMGRGAGQLGRGVTRLATAVAAASAAGVTAAITTAASYEEAFTGVRKTVEATEAEFKQLDDQLKRMAATTGTRFEDLAGIGETGGALGIDIEDMEEFIDIVNRLAVSTPLSFETAATSIGYLRNVLRLTSDEMYEFADILVALGNAGASTEDQIVDIAARFGAMARRSGLTNQEILALSSTVASMGIEVEAGGTALQRMFSNFTLWMGTADDKAKAFAKGLGLSLGELKKAWATDSEDVFKDLLDLIALMDKRTEGGFESAAFLKSIGIINQRDIRALQVLSQGVDEYERQLTVAEEAQGALNEESDKFFNTTAANWRKFQQNIRNTADTIGDELLPIVNELFSDFAEWLNQPKVQADIRQFAKDLAKDIRGVVEYLRATDWSGFIQVAQGAMSIAKAGFDLFNNLDPSVRALILAAVGINKITGGSLSLIASGIGNILMGGLKLAIPIMSRGLTPANPLFVANVTGGMGGPGGAGGGKGGGRGLPFLGLAGVAGLALMQTSSENTAALPGAAQQQQVTELWQKGILTDEEYQTLFRLAYDGIDVSDRLASLLPTPGARSPEQIKEQSKEAESFDQNLLSRFGGELEKLSDKEVIEHLIRTNEIGFKGVGTTFQVGLLNGLDPIGDVATSILKRAENPKAPGVMFEIQGHLNGLEEIQQQYLDQGDLKLAAKVQANIDTLHGLIGTTDSQNAILDYMRADAAAADASMLGYAGRTATAAEVTSRKDFSPTVDVTVNTAISISAAQANQQLQSLRQSINSRRGGSSGGGFI